ncbi:MAG: hypothetical protein M1838_004174 [Thelocarpon superellum]|nr:MAG: hypothetical protein M1838_004174 [Thelocarpon superellum]
MVDGSDSPQAPEKAATRRAGSRSGSERGRMPLDVEEALGLREAIVEGPPILALRRTRSSGKDPGPPPDGGVQAWTQAWVGHLVVFQVWGFINSYGVFQTYYVSALGHQPSDISWIGSVQIFLLFFIGTFSGRMTDAGYFRIIFGVGTFLLVLGVFLTSFCTKYWQVFLAQGVCTGLGNGLMFTPAVTVVSTYFLKKRSLAISITACGTATGGLVFPAMARQLLPRIGFPWTVRALGFVILGVSVVTNTLIRPRVRARKTGPMVEWAAFGELPYLLFAIGMFLTFWALYFAFYYIGSFARDVIHLSQDDAISLLLILNGSGFAGRLVPAFLADRYFGPLNMQIPMVFLSGVMMFAWIGVHGHASLIVFAIFYGMFASAIQGLLPATLSSLTGDVRKAGVRMGMVFSVLSFASLTGPPIAGALLAQQHGGYLYAQAFSGAVMVAGALTLIAARISHTGLHLRKRM